MADVIYSTAGLIDLLEGGISAVGAAGYFSAAKVALYTNALIPDGNTPLVAFNPPTFPGYAPSAAVVWGATTVDNLGRAVILSGLQEFQPNAPIIDAESIAGALLTDSGGTNWLACLPFDSAFSFADQDDLLAVVFPLILCQPSGGPPRVEGGLPGTIL